MLLYKTLHIIFMVTWFAGLFYLPRLYVYHSQAEDQISRDRFKIMERKLFWGIMTPGGIFTILFGVLLIKYHGMPYWLQMKLVLVFFLVIYHIWCGILLGKFKNDSNTHGHIWYRIFNEIPVLFLVLIVILVIYKPI
jgi:putative membrane protein